MNAEIWYLNRIGGSEEATRHAKEGEEQFRRWMNGEHPRYWTLCETYGEPETLAITRASGGVEAVATSVGRTVVESGLNPRSLAARLITMTFVSFIPRSEPQRTFRTPSEANEIKEQRILTLRIPPSTSITALKSLIIPAFIPRSPQSWPNPFDYRLVWETGEYDPPGHHASTMPDGGDWSDEDEDEDEDEETRRESEATQQESGLARYAIPTKRTEDWVQREVELNDGARDVGYWISAGGEARVRVTLKPRSDIGDGEGIIGNHGV